MFTAHDKINRPPTGRDYNGTITGLIGSWGPFLDGYIQKAMHTTVMSTQCISTDVLKNCYTQRSLIWKLILLVLFWSNRAPYTKIISTKRRALEEGGQGFRIQISNRPGIQDSNFKQGGIQDSNLIRVGFRIQISRCYQINQGQVISGIQISKLFSGIQFSDCLGFRIQISNGWDSGFKLCLPGP